MLSKYQIALAEGATLDPEMILTIVLIGIVLLFLVFGRRILLLIKGKSADEDLDDDEFGIEPAEEKAEEEEEAVEEEEKH